MLLPLYVMAIHISPQNSDTVDEYNMPKQVAIPVRKGVLKIVFNLWIHQPCQQPCADPC